MSSVPPCSSDVCAQYRDQIAALCKANDWPPDQPVLIVQPDGNACTCTCGGASTAAGEEADGSRKDVSSRGPSSIPPCSSDVCAQYADQIAALCHQIDWPAGRPVLIAQADGSLCTCTCGGGSAPAQETRKDVP